MASHIKAQPVEVLLRAKGEYLVTLPYSEAIQTMLSLNGRCWRGSTQGMRIIMYGEELSVLQIFNFIEELLDVKEYVEIYQCSLSRENGRGTFGVEVEDSRSVDH